MDKPVKKPRPPLYDYDECRDWLQDKYGYNERDYAGKFTSETVDYDRPYWDFWHFVIGNAEIHNGCEMSVDIEWAADAEDWQVEILSRYLEHFGEGEGDERTATFWVQW